MISIEKNTTTPKPKMIPRSEKEGLLISKPSRIDGSWIKMNVNTICDKMARTSHLWGASLKILYRIDRKFRAMISSMIMNKKKVSVLACLMSASSW
jgi:hypothetical protein